MRILITGNMGYIGPVVADRLRSSYPSAEIVGLDIGYFSHCLTNAAFLPECRIDVQHFADVREVADDVVEGTDAIVHLAAISNDPMGNRYEQATLDINYRASIRLAAMAKDLGVSKFIYASSCSVYGFAEEGARSEDSSVDPLTAYAKSKVMTERELESLASGSFQVTCLRFATACGMSPRLRLDLVLNDFVASAVACGSITVLSDGKPWRPLIHVRDMARAVEWAVQRDSRAGGNFLLVNTGCEEWNCQVSDLANAVATVFPGIEVSINKLAPPDRRSYKVDFARFRKLAPDHQPQVRLGEAIEELSSGLRAMGFQDTNFRNSSLMRLKELSNLLEKGLLTEGLEWARASVGLTDSQDKALCSTIDTT
jgi:nucleoside-diphosphate-sugar epimerase